MNEITIFENEQFGEIRTIIIDGQPWFVGKDVTEALGYTNPTKAMQDHIDTEDLSFNETLKLSRQAGAWIINESGLYSLIFSSKLESARQFKRWVTSEVLPSIRKYGVYMTKELENKLKSKELEFQKLLEILSAERRRSKENENQASKVIEELSSKADYYDDVLQSDKLIPVTLIAKDYGLSATAFNVILNYLGIQYKVGYTWTLYAKYQDKGYAKTKTFIKSESSQTRQTLYWTEKGRDFLYNILKENNIFPKKG